VYLQECSDIMATHCIIDVSWTRCYFVLKFHLMEWPLSVCPTVQFKFMRRQFERRWVFSHQLVSSYESSISTWREWSKRNQTRAMIISKIKNQGRILTILNASDGIIVACGGLGTNYLSHSQSNSFHRSIAEYLGSA